MAWVKRSARGSGQAQIIDEPDLGIRLTKGRGYNAIWNATTLSDGSPILIGRAARNNLRTAKAAAIARQHAPRTKASEVFSRRSARSRKADRSKRAKLIVRDWKGLSKWRRNTGRMDFVGVDDRPRSKRRRRKVVR